jgi:hypothetical protein
VTTNLLRKSWWHSPWSWPWKSHQGIPPAVVVRTGLGEREINAVWLAARQGPLRPGENYTPETLLALED